jgi:hypothetical protein
LPFTMFRVEILKASECLSFVYSEIPRLGFTSEPCPNFDFRTDIPSYTPRKSIPNLNT